MGMSVREFYGMTLREFHNAVKGFEEKRGQDNEVYLYGVRKIAFNVSRVMFWKKPPYKEEADLFNLDIDKEIRRQRIKRMKPIKVVKENGKQSNG